MPVRAILFDLGDTLIFQPHQPNEDALYATPRRERRPLLAAVLYVMSGESRVIRAAALTCSLQL